MPAVPDRARPVDRLHELILAEVAIVVAAVIVKLPIASVGRYQVDSSGLTLIDTTTGARWGWMGGWRQFSTGVTP
jgi:hypothetical protein